jgi:hypothetical protein
MRYQAAPRPGCSRVYAKFHPTLTGTYVRGQGISPASEDAVRCGKAKPPTEFNWRYKARGRRDNLCRPCRSAYHREHYEANRQRYIDQAAAQKKRLRHERTAYLIAYFETHPCVDCGERDPVVLEFDHLRDKLFDVTQGLDFRSWQSILDEMAKCEVVCANCHRRRTASRRGALRALMSKKPAGD